MKYKCNLCNKEFSQKSHYDVHKNRKISCVYNNDVENINNIKRLSEDSQRLSKDSQRLSEDSQNIVKDTTKKNKSLCCIYCGLTFNRNNNLTRHLKIICNNAQNINAKDNVSLLLEQNKQIINELTKLKEDNKELIEQNKELKEEIKEIKENSQELCKVSKPKNNKINNSNNIHDNTNNTNTNTNTNTNNSNNIHDNTNNSNNTNNTNTNNIIFNGPVNFGDEDISKIKKLDILSAIKTLTDCFPNFIKVINLNAKHPENQNILFNNMQNDIGTIVEDNKLVVKTKTDIIGEVISTRLPNLPGFFEA